MAFAIQSLNSNKIDRYFFETLVCVSNIFGILIKCDVETFGLMFYRVFVKLIYRFFVDFLVAVIK